jgi:hypothetical protein
LIPGFDVFFFSGVQEVLAGTHGLESMLAPFRGQSRLNGAIYRPKWANTRWIAVEEQAIKESCLDNSLRNIFGCVVENTGVSPKWLPDTHVYFSIPHSDSFCNIPLSRIVRLGKVNDARPLLDFREITGTSS